MTAHIFLLLGYAAFVPVIGWLGNLAIRALLKRSNNLLDDADATDGAPESDLKGGRYIGLFERWLIFIGFAGGIWEILLAVIALKTVARYRDLDEQANAELFLIGSLASLLWIAAVTIVFYLYDGMLGYGILETLRAVLG